MAVTESPCLTAMGAPCAAAASNHRSAGPVWTQERAREWAREWAQERMLHPLVLNPSQRSNRNNRRNLSKQRRSRHRSGRSSISLLSSRSNMRRSNLNTNPSTNRSIGSSFSPSRLAVRAVHGRCGGVGKLLDACAA